MININGTTQTHKLDLNEYIINTLTIPLIKTVVANLTLAGVRCMARGSATGGDSAVIGTDTE